MLSRMNSLSFDALTATRRFPVLAKGATMFSVM